MQTPQLFSNALTPNQAGGIAGGAYGALQAAPAYYKQMQESKFMGPLLQALLMQKQQKALQMQAQTPFAAQLAHNQALGALPLGTMAQLMESTRYQAANPIGAALMRGTTNTQFGNQPNPAQGAIPVVPSQLNASTYNPNAIPGQNPQFPVSPSSATTAQNPYYLEALKSLGGLAKKGLGDLGLGGLVGGSGQAIPPKAVLKSNAPAYAWLNPKMQPGKAAALLRETAKQEYESEPGRGKGSWNKASPAARQRQLNMIFQDSMKIKQNPY